MEPSSILTLSSEVRELLMLCALLTLCGWVVFTGLIFVVKAMIRLGDSGHTTLKQYAQDAGSWTSPVLLSTAITIAIWLLTLVRSGLLDMMPYAFICVATLVVMIVIVMADMVLVLVVKVFTPNNEPKYLPAE